MGEKVDTVTGKVDKASAVCFFSLPEGEVKTIDKGVSEISSWPNIQSFNLKLNVGDNVNKITSSLNRYGQFIVSGETRAEIDELVEKYERRINQLIKIE